MLKWMCGSTLKEKEKSKRSERTVGTGTSQFGYQQREIKMV